jgi:UDP-GlcNAc3NAcA epimerase
MKIVTILGARPQFVKASVLSLEFAKHADIEECIVHTGQHFNKNMSDIFFQEMGIPEPSYNLGINSLSHGAMTGRMLEEIEKVIQKEKADWVLVYGDTNSTLAGALAAKKLGVKVAHVESGLRSYNMSMPEEINRILTDRISDILFCPTDSSVENLKKEGFDNINCRIVKTGDVMFDSVLHFGKMADQKSSILKDRKLKKGDFILATVHRQENTDDIERLNNILMACEHINKQKPVVFLAHPRTKHLLKASKRKWNFKVIDAVGYFDMLQLLSNCQIVLTDSGGLQKEAYWMKKPCITVREETEWMELVDHGYNIIAGNQTDRIIDCYQTMLSKPIQFTQNLYGNGNAASAMVKAVLE